MGIILGTAARAAVVVGAASLVGAGFVLALRGEASVQVTAPPDEGATVATPVLAKGSATATPVASAPASDPSPAAPATTASAPAPDATATPSAIVAVAQPPRPPAPPIPTATIPAPGSDLPKYRDTAVLALAADAVLPSGKTFRQCVEAPPSEENWPTPVHLYYEGNGRWLVETHLSEVQVVFDEATGTFSPRNFAPPNPGCR